MSNYIDYDKDWFRMVNTWNLLICQYSTEIMFWMLDQYVVFWSLVEDL